MTLFSYDIFAAQGAGGVSRCMIELMRALATIDVDCEAWAGWHANDLLSAAATEAWSSGRIHITGRLDAPARFRGALRNERPFSAWVGKRPNRIVHRTYYPVVDLCGSRVRRVETLHDMWDERAARAGTYSTRLKGQLKRRAVARADVVVCVSESTRAEAIELWPWARNRLLVIPHGVRRLAEAQPYTHDRPFFLFVGRRDLYKNFSVAVRALKLTNLADHQLVCFGGGPLAPSERAFIAAQGVGGRVVQLGGGDSVLASLYEAATALLYPSSYEGFGLPLLEAMIHGCPVIAAPLTSLPEVGGDAAVYADPLDLDAWAHLMEVIATDVGVASDLRQRGADRAATFSWERTALLHREVYAQLS
jgi:glycosyltransferase involved in cell wall biosynthesis